MRIRTTRALSRRDQDGFTLIEVTVALGLLMLVSLSILPLFIGSVRAANEAKAHTQAKNLLQERVEVMRNLPFHVPYSTGAQYVDLLDIYLHDMASPSTNAFCSSAAYVAATKTYRCVLDSAKVGFTGFTETIETQFLDKDRNVVAPIAGYNSLAGAPSVPTTASDVPASQMIGARITVNWTVYGKAKSYSTYTQIGNGSAGAPQTVAKFRNSAVSVNSSVDDASPATVGRLDVGLLSADTSVSTGATARGVATGAYSSLSSGEFSANQAFGSVDAPPDQTSFTTVNGTASSGVPCTSNIVCFGPTRVANVTGSAAGGLPVIGTATNPVTATLVKGGSASDRGFWFGNVLTGSTQAGLVALKVQDSSAPPTAASPTQLVRSVQGSPSGGWNVPCGSAATAVSPADFATSKGYITTTGGSTHSVTACTTATARRVDVMPTSFAPDGVVQVTLARASLSCTSNGASAGAPTSDWAATVNYWNYATSSYVTLSIAKGSADPLTSSLLIRGPGGVQVGVTASGTPLYLGDYIRSWSSGSLTTAASSGTARQSDLTAVTISTVPTRDGDASGASSINLSLGQLTCLAQDNR